MKTFKVFEKETGLYVGTITVTTTESETKYNDFVLKEV
jgi:hypothetical protein